MSKGPDKPGGRSNLGSLPVKGFAPTYGIMWRRGKKFAYGPPAEETEITSGEAGGRREGHDLPFVHLHVHSNFSFLDGGSRVPELVARAAELGQPALALTDHDGLYGIVRLAMAAEQREIRPIFGAELGVEPLAGDHDPPLSTPELPYHLVLLAETREGYANLSRLVSEAHLSVPDRDRPPTVTREMLLRYREGLICLTGCRQGEVGRLIDAGRDEEARGALRALGEIFGPDHLFVEVTHYGYEPHREVEAGQGGAPVYEKVRGEDGRLRHRPAQQLGPDRAPHPHPATAGPRATRDPGPRREVPQAGSPLPAAPAREALGEGPTYPSPEVQTGENAKLVAKRKQARRGPLLRPDLPHDRPQYLNPADYDVGFHDDGSAWELSCHAYGDRLLRLARDVGLLAVLTTDAHYAYPEHRALHLVTRAAGRDQPLSDYPDGVPGVRCLQSRAELEAEVSPLLSLHVSSHARYVAHSEAVPQVLDFWRKQLKSHQASLAATEAAEKDETATDLAPADRGVHVTQAQPPLLPLSPLDVPYFIAKRCRVDLDLGTYHFPQVSIPEGETAYSLLAKRCFRGMERKYQPVPPRALELLEHELALIEQMGFAHYFLVVHDIVRWARARGIANSGRGSAGNSLVCHVLDITASEPIRHNLLFERFLNPDRREMPDIDIDFCSERRDEVIEHIYRSFGRENVAVVANVNTMSPRMAVRIVAEALGFTPVEINALAKHVPRHGDAGKIRDYLAGGWPELAESLLQDEARYGPLLDLVERLDGFPIHLGTHLGGFVIADKPVTYYAPLQWAAKGVVVTQFNKDDVADLGLVKMDILGLKTHSAVMETVHLVRHRTGRKIDPFDLHPDDPAAYDPAAYEIISNGGSIGLFQLESAGQRNLATRLQESTFDDIIAAIALYRPGPLEAEMITPFIDRRWGYEAVSLPHPSMAEALADTYGVILYQEQVLRVAQLVAGFSPAEADSLRRAMTREKSREEMAKIGQTFVGHAVERGVPEEAAREVFRQLEGFAAYGFNKSHSVCFAVISYATAYLKAHYPAEFLAAIMNNQPMAFYTPRTVLNDARRFGLEVRPLDINLSGRGFTVEDAEPPDPRTYDPFVAAWTKEHGYGLSEEDLTALEAIHGDSALEQPRGWGASLSKEGKLLLQAAPESTPLQLPPAPGEDAPSEGEGKEEALLVPAARDFRPPHSPRARAGVSPGACLLPEGALAPGAGRALRVGLRYLKQMSERALKRIEQERRHAPFASFEDFYLRTQVEYPVAENLIRVGAFDALEPDRTELLWRLPLLHDRLETLSGAGNRGQLRAFFTQPQAAGLARQWTTEDRVRTELELLGLTVTCHPLQLYEPELRRLGVKMSYELPALGDEVAVTVAGVYERAQNPWMRSGRRTMFLTLEDAYGLFECVVFESKLPKYAPVVARATYFLIKGRLQNNRKRGLAIVAEEIYDLEDVLRRMEPASGRAAGQLPDISGPALGSDEAAGQMESQHVGGGQRPARVGREQERPTYAEQKLLKAERKAARGIREQEVYGPGKADPRTRPPGAGTRAIPKRVG